MFPLRKKQPKPSAPVIKPLLVLVADDVREIQELVTHWLEEAGHTVIHASTGREVIDAVRGQPVDLVVTDLVMPGGSGLDAILAISRIRPATRVLAISGGGPTMPAEAGLRVAKGLGADATLMKPFNQQRFMEAVQRLTGGEART